MIIMTNIKEPFNTKAYTEPTFPDKILHLTEDQTYELYAHVATAFAKQVKQVIGIQNAYDWLMEAQYSRGMFYHTCGQVALFDYSNIFKTTSGFLPRDIDTFKDFVIEDSDYVKVVCDLSAQLNTTPSDIFDTLDELRKHNVSNPLALMLTTKWDLSEDESYYIIGYRDGDRKIKSKLKTKEVK